MMIRTERKWQAATVAVAGLGIAILTAGAIYLATTNTELRADLRDARAEVSASTSNATSLYEQLLDAGLDPVAEEPAEVVAGSPGAAGARGLPGIDGVDGSDGADGQAGVAGIDSTATGATGETGSAGTAGQDGTDGGQGVTGPAGVDGAAGADGAPGATGATGETPVSWTFTDRTGQTHTCTRAEPYDPAQPTYNCTTE